MNSEINNSSDNDLKNNVCISKVSANKISTGADLTNGSADVKDSDAAISASAVFNENNIEKKIFDDRWVRFAFGSQGKIKNKNLNLGITEFEEGKTSMTHQHNIDEALYILAGQGTVKVGNKLHTVKEKDFIFVPNHTDHTMITDKGSKLKIFFVFAGEITIRE